MTIYGNKGYFLIYKRLLKNGWTLRWREELGKPFNKFMDLPTFAACVWPMNFLTKKKGKS